jgi:hypothetical protein
MEFPITDVKLASLVRVGATNGDQIPWGHSHTQEGMENPCMSETQNQFKGFRGFLWLAVGFLLLAAILGSVANIVAHLVKCL